LGLPLFPGRGVSSRQDCGNDDEMTGVEVRRGELAFDFRFPEVRPTFERHAFEQVGPVTDGIDISPAADAIRTDLGLLTARAGVWHFREIERVVETVGGVEPTDV